MATYASIRYKDRAFGGTAGVNLPNGSTAQRVNLVGTIRYNTNLNRLEKYDATGWGTLSGNPIVTSCTPDTDVPDGGASIVIAGTNFTTTGTVSVTVGGTACPSVTVNNSSQITVTTPAKSDGAYTVEVTNSDGNKGSLANGLTFSNLPVWNTAADTVLAQILSGGTVNVTSLSAPEASDTIAYTETTSVLSGISLSVNSSTCAITGTMPTVSSTTVYTFTLRATDDEGQTADRQFKLQADVNYYGDGSDGALSTQEKNKWQM